MAPELVCSENKGHTCKVDIWALGVLAFYLLSGGHLPFDVDSEQENSQQNMIDKILNEEPNWDLLSQVSPKAIEIIKLCLNKD